MSPDYVVEYLLQMTKGSGGIGINWKQYVGNGCFNHGYTAVCNGVRVYIREVFNRHRTWIELTFEKEGEAATIQEPEIHLSRAPIGKFLRAFGSPWPKEPNADELANERLKILLNNLWGILKQRDRPFVRLSSVPEEYERNESVRQKLFYAVTGTSC